MYNLTENQKTLAKWLVQEVRAGKLDEEFEIYWVSSMDQPTPEAGFLRYRGTIEEAPEITAGSLDALAANDLLLYRSVYKTRNSNSSYEDRRICTLTGKIYSAVDTNFDAPDTSFIKYLTPLADVNGFDQELKRRCLPILGAGSSDPTLWDSAVRTAGVILEERLRDVGSISDPNRTGRTLVNDIFKDTGTLASKFTVPSEREGYRELYAGIVGAFRNPSAHRLIDPSPDEGGAFIVFVNGCIPVLQ